METKDLKKYAPQARADFIEAVSAKAAVYGLLHNEIVPLQQGGDTVIIGDRAFPGVIANKRRELERQINESGYDQFIESIAYTWFNRLVAIRYMEVHGYLDHGYRVLSHPEGKATPEVLEHAERLDLPSLDADKVIDLKLDGSKDDELYRLILIAQCNALARLMPFMFGGTDDATELLLPDNLLHTDSLVRKLVAGLPSDSLQSVEAIGWLYQFYISEKKDDVFAALKKGNKITPENIPAATQLFTPHWIVRYLVENSLGRLWMLNNPGSGLIDQMDYYIKPEEPESDFLKIESPEEIKICDPACGSGHMLTYAFDLLYALYEQQGYQAADIPRLILENNLHGIEIDGRAGALSAFALMMKAREKYRRFLTTSKVVQPNICVLANIHEDEQSLTEYFEFRLENNSDFCHVVEEIGNTWIANGKIRQYQKFLNVESISEALIDQLIVESGLLDVVKEITDASEVKGNLKKYIDGKSEWSNLSKGDRSIHTSRVFWHFVDNGEIENYINLFDLKRSVSRALVETVNQFKESDNFGSLIRPVLTGSSKILESLEHQSARDALLNTNNSLLITNTHHKVLTALQQADYLSPKYHVVVANPPYMGSGSHNPALKEMVGEEYSDTKADLYASFIQRNLDLSVPKSLIGMITIPNWMFLSSFESLRHTVLTTKRLASLIHNGRGVWGSDFGSCSFIVENKHTNAKGTFLRLFTRQGEVKSNDELVEAFFDQIHFPRFHVSGSEFSTIPGMPLAYWLSPELRRTFTKESLANEIITEGQNKTANNERFVRFHWEVSRSEYGRDKKWLLYSKGGDYRKWYGNLEHVVDWSPSATKHYRASSSCRIIAEKFWYKAGITWTDITSTGTGFRYLPQDTTFDMAGPTAFFNDDAVLPQYLCLLNSTYVGRLLPVLNPTLHAQLRDVKAIPNLTEITQTPETEQFGLEAIAIARQDWDRYEGSIDFSHPALSFRDQSRIEESFRHGKSQWSSEVEKTKHIEEVINERIVSNCSLQGEFETKVSLKSITLFCNPAYRYASEKSDAELEALLLADTIREFISYAVGCMLGRYSLDKPGLILANQGETADNYRQQIPEPTFPPDEDNIIPLLDSDWFEDDITNRFLDFLKVTFGTEHFDENLTFLENTVYPDNLNGKKRKTIRDYFISEYYSHHLKLYKKRPIYWLFSSGKQKAFQCVIYMHRYNPGTMSRIRTNYVVKLLGLFNSRIDQLECDIPAATSTSHRKQLEKERDKLVKKRTELQEFDEKLRHYADMRIEIDLDDGVKVNYGKFGDLLADVKAVTGKTSLKIS